LARGLISLAVLVVSWLAAGSAWASFPGRNGVIVYGWIGEGTHRAGPTHTSIRAVAPRTGRVRVLRDCPLIHGGPVPYARCIVSSPSVSPDGRRVAFPTVRVIVRDPAPWEFQHGLAMTASDGTDLEEHRTAHPYGSLAWSPGGDRLLLDRQLVPGSSAGSAIFLASLDGTELGQVTPEWTGAPDWSSTGRIAFVTTSIAADCAPRCFDIWTTRRGETARRLTYRGGTSPSWSPHGSKLAFVRSVGEREEVFTVRRDGRGLRRLTHRGGYSPSWSPDGNWIAFIRNGDLYVVRTNGRGVRRLVAGMREFGEGPQVTSLDWQARSRR
jgi:Tol biopolymer transport system component